MKLKRYRSKRNLKESREPPAVTHSSSSKELRFCIQKHAARRLHYDFRLEFRGVLLSWAVPKGLSLDPHDKRLAIHVEDHPLDYQYFEGVIPKGHYGAGTVEIWDQGLYTIPNTSSRKEMEKQLEEGLQKGHFTIVLQGERLQGAFTFQKLKRDEEDKHWLVIKKEDDYAHSNEEERPSGAKKSAMPSFIAPMLATLVKEPFSDDEWLFEIKWDGYRALAFIDRGKVQLISRTQHVWNQIFPTIVNSLEKMEGQVILDGEIVVLDSKGRSNFQLLQTFQKEGNGTLCYTVFDILYKDGKDLREIPLIERKKILTEYLNRYPPTNIHFSDHIIGRGEAFFHEASKAKLEGIIGKRLTSTYQSRRSDEWVKIKTKQRQEVVIGGFTAPRGSRKRFGALLVGIYNDKNELQYAGHVGGGFNSKLLDDVYEKLEPLIRKTSPFKESPKPNAPVTWVKPLLVCEVAFAEWTKDDIMRQPIFQGLRVDKTPKKVKKETPEQLNEKGKKKTKKNLASQLELSNLDKIYWPEEGYTKEDLIHYYETISPFILPYLKDRPIVLHRFPDGVKGKDFYQKDLSTLVPDWIRTYPISHEGKQDHYLLIDDLPSLLYAINLGSIDLHPFLSRCKKIHNPDFCVLDLDPHEVPFDTTIETALLVHEMLESIEVAHYCKTSGGKGLHIFIPLHGKYDYEQSKQFAEILATLVHQRAPSITSLERSPQKRPKKIYLDYLQNRLGQMIVAPYAVRPKEGAPVSTPISWEELRKGFTPKQFNIKNVPNRLKKMGDIFKPVLGAGVNLKSALSKIKKLVI